jgi:hypothetical protein
MIMLVLLLMIAPLFISNRSSKVDEVILKNGFYTDVVVIDNEVFIYKGNYKNGKMDGYGELYHNASGDLRYKGYFKDGLYHGHGLLYYPHLSKLKYNGTFSIGMYNGFGVLNDIYSDKIKYVGEFKDNEYHGIGKYYHQNYLSKSLIDYG